jgi:hypothetical protein
MTAWQMAVLSALVNAPLEYSKRDGARRDHAGLVWVSQLYCWQMELAQVLYPELQKAAP